MKKNIVQNTMALLFLAFFAGCSGKSVTTYDATSKESQDESSKIMMQGMTKEEEAEFMGAWLIIDFSALGEDIFKEIDEETKKKNEKAVNDAIHGKSAQEIIAYAKELAELRKKENKPSDGEKALDPEKEITLKSINKRVEKDQNNKSVSNGAASIKKISGYYATNNDLVTKAVQFSDNYSNYYLNLKDNGDFYFWRNNSVNQTGGKWKIENNEIVCKGVFIANPNNKAVDQKITNLRFGIDKKQIIEFSYDGENLTESFKDDGLNTWKALKKVQAEQYGFFSWEEQPITPNEQLITPKITKEIKLTLNQAVQRGKLDIVKQLLNRGVDINLKEESGIIPVSNGNTALHVAAFNNEKEIAKYLIEKGAEVNIRNKFASVTPLHWASMNGFDEMVNILIKSGANVSIKTIQFGLENETPLHWASTFARFDVIKTLVKNGANVNAGNMIGQTPLHNSLSSSEGKKGVDLHKLLISLGADKKIKDEDGETALDYAKKYDFKDIIMYYEDNK